MSSAIAYQAMEPISPLRLVRDEAPLSDTEARGQALLERAEQLLTRARAGEVDWAEPEAACRAAEQFYLDEEGDLKKRAMGRGMANLLSGAVPLTRANVSLAEEDLRAAAAKFDLAGQRFSEAESEVGMASAKFNVGVTWVTSVFHGSGSREMAEQARVVFNEALEVFSRLELDAERDAVEAMLAGIPGVLLCADAYDLIARSNEEWRSDKDRQKAYEGMGKAAALMKEAGQYLGESRVFLELGDFFSGWARDPGEETHLVNAISAYAQARTALERSHLPASHFLRLRCGKSFVSALELVREKLAVPRKVDSEALSVPSIEGLETQAVAAGTAAEEGTGAITDPPAPLKTKIPVGESFADASAVLERGRNLTIEKVAALLREEQDRPRRKREDRETFRDEVNGEMGRAALAFKVTEVMTDKATGQLIRVELYGDRLRLATQGNIEMRVARTGRGLKEETTVEVVRAEHMPEKKRIEVRIEEPAPAPDTP